MAAGGRIDDLQVIDDEELDRRLGEWLNDLSVISASILDEGIEMLLLEKTASSNFAAPDVVAPYRITDKVLSGTDGSACRSHGRVGGFDGDVGPSRRVSGCMHAPVERQARLEGSQMPGRDRAWGPERESRRR